MQLKLLHQFEDFFDTVTSLKWCSSPDSSLLAATSTNDLIRIWDIDGDISYYSLPKTYVMNPEICWLYGSKALVGHGERVDRRTIWKRRYSIDLFESPTFIRRTVAEVSKCYNSFVLAKDNEVAYFSDALCGEVKCLSLKDGEWEWSASVPISRPQLCTSPVQAMLPILSDNSNEATLLWDVSTRQCLSKLDPMSACVVNLRNNSLYFADYCGVISAYDIERKVKSAITKGHGGTVTGLSISGDCAFLASTAMDAVTRVWKLPELMLVAEFQCPREAGAYPTGAIAFHPTKPLIALLGPHGVRTDKLEQSSIMIYELQ